jgi:hypothetical protein
MAIVAPNDVTKSELAARFNEIRDVVLSDAMKQPDRGLVITVPPVSTARASESGAKDFQ